jgi:thymidylate synthase (FAD)
VNRPRAEQLGEHGSVELVGISLDLLELDSGFDPDSFTLDAAIERAARVSYAQETRSVRDTAGLLDYLMRHRHTSPFEQVSLKFKIRAPLFVIQQMLRHRTAKLNQESARYSVIEDDVYVPTRFRSQGSQNKQGSDSPLDESAQDTARELYRSATGLAQEHYQQLLELGVARELARGVIPHATYSTLVWQMDLHNLMHFLKLRLDAHAQEEIRDVAWAVYDLARPWAPLTFAAWENHVLNAVTLSKDEFRIVRSLIDSDTLAQRLESSTLSASRRRELLEKLS